MNTVTLKFIWIPLFYCCSIFSIVFIPKNEIKEQLTNQANGLKKSEDKTYARQIDLFAHLICACVRKQNSDTVTIDSILQCVNKDFDSGCPSNHDLKNMIIAYLNNSQTNTNQSDTQQNQ